MDSLTLEDLKSLSRSTGGVHVSIYMPSARFGPDSQVENSRRLRNLLKTVSEQLAARGMRPAEIDALLAPARLIAEDRPFWLRASDGLAIFIGPTVRWFRLPVDFGESVVISERYYLKPLLAQLGSDRHFYVLALSLKHVHLLRGTFDSLAPVDLEGAPASLSEALQWDNFEKRSLQFHTQTSSASGGRRPAVFHGSGEPDPKEEITRYFRGIDRALKETLTDDAPIILAGVEYLLPLYREVSSIPSLVSESVWGNPDSLGSEALHQRAWAVAQSVFADDRVAAAERIGDLWATSRATADPETLVPAALGGRVETLFVALDREVWGTVNEKDGAVEIHPRYEPGDEDLLDRAALQTLLAGGDIFAVAAAEMPRGDAAVALLRY
ncbi:MAG: baeRF7 domain-containing protein [Coriobacteriia bacterium]